jgi:hypothetical protein
MINKNLFKIFIIFHGLFLLSDSKFTMTIKKINITANKPGILEIKKLDIKGQSYNLSAEILKPLDNITVDMKYSVKIRSTFRTLIDVKNIEWCSITKQANSIKFFGFAKAIWRDVLKTVPSLVSECPLKGPIELMNVKPPENVGATLPEGLYNQIFLIKDSLQKCEIIADFTSKIEKYG